MINLDLLLKDKTTVGITGHIHPDGDCVGSTLGLWNYITENYPEKEVYVFLGEIPKVFNFLKGADKIKDPNDYKDKIFDLFFCLDCADVNRPGDAYPLFKNAKTNACIDHHISNKSFSDNSYIIPDESSTCELVFNLLDLDKISKSTAECLYVGMVHDTGVFQYSCTTKKTMEIAGILMDKGIDYPWIIKYTFYEKTFVQNKLLGRALLNAKLYDDDRVVLSILTKEDFKECNATSMDTEGIVSQLRYTTGCDVAVFIYQNPDRTFKVSLRSTKDIDVSKIATKLGGGGHVKAAGATVGYDAEIEAKKIIDMILEMR